MDSIPLEMHLCQRYAWGSERSSACETLEAPSRLCFLDQLLPEASEKRRIPRYRLPDGSIRLPFHVEVTSVTQRGSLQSYACTTRITRETVLGSTLLRVARSLLGLIMPVVLLDDGAMHQCRRAYPRSCMALLELIMPVILRNVTKCDYSGPANGRTTHSDEHVSGHMIRHPYPHVSSVPGNCPISLS